MEPGACGVGRSAGDGSVGSVAIVRAFGVGVASSLWRLAISDWEINFAFSSRSLTAILFF
ncbi:hypothetical protein [Mastigocoleus sp. MO_188.B34]|uniref:hypothetical protein n=1 Tax=Mastigocoleus sp. MO_188.B34 TaxID=3036635 RepID=UPI00262E4EF0|nr:hypothetical protein [Mastigocoleus sp. MO_188.B34]MDJ0696563.1 hypothetical protein [Mastigocoleus sp. MO_188.B34]